MVSAISGPLTYQGQGDKINSIVSYLRSKVLNIFEYFGYFCYSEARFLSNVPVECHWTAAG